MPLGGYWLAWHGSLQHEVIHEHPTPWRGVNEALIAPSLWLWLPFREYRRSHRIHHQVDYLTEPTTDPESYYITDSDWQVLPHWQRMLWRANMTLLGRLTIGPLIAVTINFRQAVSDLWHAPHRNAHRNWLLHLLCCIPVVVWVVPVCNIPITEYVLLYIYPGISLTLLRSFAEHQPSTILGRRTAIVESNRLMSLLFLYNNLHEVHHRYLALPWYQLPKRWRQTSDEILATNANYRFAGYCEQFQRYLLTSPHPVIHPTSRRSV